MSPGPWSATIRVRRPDDAAADRLHRALAPEAEREVPRARSALALGPGQLVSLTVSASETGALRAALKTYLGWIDLADATERAISARAAAPGRGSAPAAPEAVK